jgi:hypothetical protein
VPTTGAARAKEITLARSATISIRNQEPHPCGKVEVAPWTGRVHFVNKDSKEYRLRFWKPNSEPLKGLDMLLPAKGRITVMIKKDDVFHFGVFHLKGDEASLGKGGGPIVN